MRAIIDVCLPSRCSFHLYALRIVVVRIKDFSYLVVRVERYLVVVSVEVVDMFVT